jgi:hypothetical protein
MTQDTGRTRDQASGVDVEQNVVTIAEFPLRTDRLCRLGVHDYRSRTFWHIRAIGLGEGGAHLELWTKSFSLHTAELFGTAHQKLLQYIRSGDRR